MSHLIVDKVNIRNYIAFIKAVAQSSSWVVKNKLEGVRFRENEQIDVQRTTYVSPFHILDLRIYCDTTNSF